jgi:hypothetical protein
MKIPATQLAIGDVIDVRVGPSLVLRRVDESTWIDVLVSSEGDSTNTRWLSWWPKTAKVTLIRRDPALAAKFNAKRQAALDAFKSKPRAKTARRGISEAGPEHLPNLVLAREGEMEKS